MDGWMDGWDGMGWMDGRAVLRTADCSQKQLC